MDSFAHLHYHRRQWPLGCKFKGVMRLLLASVLLVACAAAATSRREYRKAVAGKHTVASAGASAAFRTMRNRPREWGRGPVGAVKRFGSSLAQNAAKQTIQFGVAGLRHEN